MCVKSGEPTQAAVRVTAIAMANADKWQLWLGPLAILLARLRHTPAFQVILPVSPRTWSWVTRGRMWSVLAAGVGAALMVVSVHNGGAHTLVASWLFLVPAWLIRARTYWRRWVGVEYRPDRLDIRLTRVHPKFAKAAGDLWVKSLAHL